MQHSLTPSFLCATHRHWLRENPKKAGQALKRHQSVADELRQQGQFHKALPFAGCAFDTICLLLDDDEKDENTLFTFTACTVILTDTCLRLSMNIKAREIYQYAVRRVSQLYTNVDCHDPCHMAAKACLKALHELEYMDVCLDRLADANHAEGLH